MAGSQRSSPPFCLSFSCGASADAVRSQISDALLYRGRAGYTVGQLIARHLSSAILCCASEVTKWSIVREWYRKKFHEMGTLASCKSAESSGLGGHLSLLVMILCTHDTGPVLTRMQSVKPSHLLTNSGRLPLHHKRARRLPHSTTPRITFTMTAGQPPVA